MRSPEPESSARTRMAARRLRSKRSEDGPRAGRVWRAGRKCQKGCKSVRHGGKRVNSHVEAAPDGEGVRARRVARGSEALRRLAWERCVRRVDRARELELELIQSQMAQKPMLRGEVRA